MKTTHLLRRNIAALLKARGHSQHDLAFYCRRSDAWLSKIMSERGDEQARSIPLKYLDRIADFFGLATYQLFQPGISPLTERRTGNDRRSGRDRRVGAIQAGTTTAQDLHLSHEDIAAVLRFRSLSRSARADLLKTLDEQVRGRRPRPSPDTAVAGPASVDRIRASNGRKE